jgi:fumarate reductase subunit C
MLRELSSVVLALFLIFYLIQIARLGPGAAAYDAFVASLRSPGMVLFNFIALIAAVYHTVTWLQLAGIVMVVRLGARAVPPQRLIVAGYLGWAIASLVVFLVVVL